MEGIRGCAGSGPNLQEAAAPLAPLSWEMVSYVWA